MKLKYGEIEGEWIPLPGDNKRRKITAKLYRRIQRLSQRFSLNEFETSDCWVKQKYTRMNS